MQWKQFVRQAAYSVLAAASVWVLNGCNGSQPPAKPPEAPVKPAEAGHADGHDDHDHHHHHHAEKGPHDGTLVALGDEAAHVELVLDKETGKLTAYILDNEAKEAVAIKQETIVVAFTLTEEEHEGEEKKAKSGDVNEFEEVTLSAVSATDGSASEFAGESEKLKGAEHFDGVFPGIVIKGKEQKPAEFKFPEGNEHDHHHH